MWSFNALHSLRMGLLKPPLCHFAPKHHNDYASITTRSQCLVNAENCGRGQAGDIHTTFRKSVDFQKLLGLQCSDISLCYDQYLGANVPISSNYPGLIRYLFLKLWYRFTVDYRLIACIMRCCMRIKNRLFHHRVHLEIECSEATRISDIMIGEKDKR